MAKSTVPLPIPIRALTQHKPLRFALLAGALTAIALALLPNQLSPLTRALAAWDAGIVIYLVSLLWKMRDATPAHIAAHAAETDEGRHFVLIVSVAAVAISVSALVMEVGAPEGASDLEKQLHLAFVFATVALSWLFVHATFATHYAHEYYGPGDSDDKLREGLKFPGGGKPDFWDFWHFALVIGVANQTADVAITSRAIRHIVTLHGVAAFLFNTVILALAINYAASLFQ